MGGMWTMLSISKMFGARHEELIEAKIKRFRAQMQDPRYGLVDRVQQLEDDLGRALLLLHSLAETCIAKGILQPEELGKMAAKLDLSDGVADGKLDPQTVRPQQEDQPEPAANAEEYFRRLEEEG